VKKNTTKKVQELSRMVELDTKKHLNYMAGVSIPTLNKMLVLTDFTLNF
jgi:hypothetical protein